MNTITVYDSPQGFRVVRGEHKLHAGADRYRVRVYDDATLAYGLERQQGIRDALLRIAPDLDQRVACPPLLEVPLELAHRPSGELYTVGGYRVHATTRIVQTPDQEVGHCGVDYFEKRR
jgi:hypothetical protein